MLEEKKSVSVTETEPVIKKIMMKDNGRSGLEVVYQTSEKRDGVISEIDYKRKQKRPTQSDLRELFSSLREHLLACCGYYWPNEKIKELMCANTLVTYVQTNSHGAFQIGGTRTVLDGNYTIAINTAMIDEENYKESEKLMDIIENIRKEAALFMKGIKGADKKQVVHDFMFVKRGITNPEEAYKTMSEQEILDITKEALGDSGLSIIEENGELVVGHVEPSQTEAVELKTETILDTDVPFVEQDVVDNLDAPSDNDIPSF